MIAKPVQCITDAATLNTIRANKAANASTGGVDPAGEEMVNFATLVTVPPPSRNHLHSSTFIYISLHFGPEM